MNETFHDAYKVTKQHLTRIRKIAHKSHSDPTKPPIHSDIKSPSLESIKNNVIEVKITPGIYELVEITECISRENNSSNQYIFQSKEIQEKCALH